MKNRISQDGMKELKRYVEVFEDKIKKALRFKYSEYFRGYPPNFLEHYFHESPLGRWDALSFINIYTKAKQYPLERLKGCIYYLMDIKLELYYLLEVILGLYNHLIFNRNYSKSDIVQYPYLHLIYLALEQTTVLMSAILWERIFNLIYYLENGEDLEKFKRNKTSKFWNFIKGNKKWSFMLDYRDAINKYRDSLRTPETHKYSTFRKQFLNGIIGDSDYTMRLINIAMNVFWDNLINILQGRNASISFKDKFDL